MLFAGLFFAELLALFVLSKMLTKRLSSLIYHLSRSKSVTIYSMAFLFFPGTLLHELAHFLMAGLLFVKVYHFELVPKLEGDYVKLGSVGVAQSDIFRRFFIGVAPVLFGTFLLLSFLYYAASNGLFENYIFILLMGYASFEIGNTMFSSKKDMEGALELLAVVSIFIIIFYFIGLRLPEGTFTRIFENPIVKEVFNKGSIFLLFPLVVDGFVLGILSFLSPRRAFQG
jgi:hypothetical protein